MTYDKYDKSNIFSKIIAGEIPCNKVYEDEHTLAFYDINGAKKVHVLVIPKGQYCSFDDFATTAEATQVAVFFRTVQKVAQQLGLDERGYRLITNHGADGNQSVPHFHVHILGGENVGSLVAGESQLR